MNFTQISSTAIAAYRGLILVNRVTGEVDLGEGTLPGFADYQVLPSFTAVLSQMADVGLDGPSVFFDDR